jgi:tetratricopeptide (TPR) repeat protein
VGKVVTGLFVVIALAGVGGWVGWKLLSGDSFMKRLDGAVAQGRIFSPPGDCAVDIFASEKAKNPGNPKLAVAAQKIRAKVEPQIQESIQRWAKDSDPTVNWDDVERSGALLNSLYPEDKSIGARHAYAKAQKAITAKQYSQAKDLYTQALDLQPSWALALNGLGKVYMREDSPFHDEAAALNLYRRAIQADPTFTWAYMNIGLYHRLKGNPQLGQQWLLKALATYPTKSSILRNLGDVCVDLSDYPAALDYYERALPQEQDPSSQEKLRASIRRVRAKLGQ